MGSRSERLVHDTMSCIKPRVVGTWGEASGYPGVYSWEGSGDLGSCCVLLTRGRVLRTRGGSWGWGPGDPAGLGLGVPGGGDSRGLGVLGNKGYPRGLADPEWVLNDLNFN